MEIRKLSEAELEQALAVWSQAFEHGDRMMRDWKEWEEVFTGRMATYGVFDTSGLQATVLVVDYRVHFGADRVLPMAGVCGVACLPAARGKGYASEGVRYALAQMRANGHFLSILEPFHWGFYQNLGWDWVGVQRRYTVTTRTLQPDPETENVRAVLPVDRGKVCAVYTQTAKRYRGMLERTPKEWDWILNDREKEYTYAYLYEKEGVPEGYLVYRGGKKEETRLREFLALTPRARRALLGLLRRHEMQVDKFRWTVPCDDTLWTQYYHWDIETVVRPAMMGRIVDVAAALQHLRPEASVVGKLTLQVTDANAPWNTGGWRIESEGGRVRVEPTDAQPGVSLDIRALAQAYFGTPSLEELRACERISVQTEAEYRLLQVLLDGPPMWINDDF